MHFQNNNIKKITERNTITRYKTFILGNPHGRENPTKTSSIINCQYNAKTKTKPPKINQD
jgi:hypothetical protein